MKQFTFIFFGLLFFLNTFSQIPNVTFIFSSNTTETIAANKIIGEVVYSYTFNKSEIKDSVLTHTYYYDSLGSLIVERVAKTKNHTGSIRKYENIYNSSGKLLRQTVDNQSLKLVTTYEFEYDSAGNEITKYDYNKDTTRLTIEQKIYNEKNQVVQLQTKINNNDLYTSRRYYYSASNDLSKEEAFDSRGNLIYSYIYEYDKPLNKKTVYLENEDGRKKTAEYFYNNDKQCIKINTTFESVTSISRTTTGLYTFKQVTENIYNPDQTIFESNFYLDGKKIQMNRHFYFTE